MKIGIKKIGLKEICVVAGKLKELAMGCHRKDEEIGQHFNNVANIIDL